MKTKYRILFIEDEKHFRNLVTEELKQIASVANCEDLPSALSMIERERFDLIITDIDLGEGAEGLEVLEKVRTACPETYTVVLTAHKEDEMILACSNCNCNEYYYKAEFVKDRKMIIRNLINKIDESNLDDFFQTKYITSSSELKNKIRPILASGLPKTMNLMVLGPPGVGKTVLVEALHEYFGGTDENFSHCNLRELSDELIESEIFGHVKGAFTGATKDKVGLFEKAAGGTLFLDEIATLSEGLQIKLLNVLANRSFSKVGSTKKIPLDCRVVTATCEDINSKIESGEMRHDFFRRIMGATIEIPGLKDRREDIPLLINHFRRTNNSRRILISDEAMEALIAYDWRAGNIGEVKEVITGLVALSKEIMVKLSDLPESIRSNRNPYELFNQSSYLSDGVLEDIRGRLIRGSLTLKGLLSSIEIEVANHLLNSDEDYSTHTLAKLMGISWEKAKKINDKTEHVCA